MYIRLKPYLYSNTLLQIRFLTSLFLIGNRKKTESHHFIDHAREKGF